MNKDIARNTTSLEVLEKLANDDDSRVRMAVAKNINTSTKTLDGLSRDSDFWVRAVTALNKNVSIEALNRLSKDQYGPVRHQVARNPKTPYGVLLILEQDEFEYVRETAFMTYAMKGHLEFIEKLKLSRLCPDEILKERINDFNLFEARVLGRLSEFVVV